MNTSIYLRELILASDVVRSIVGTRVYSLTNELTDTDEPYITYFQSGGLPAYDWQARYWTEERFNLDLFTGGTAEQVVLLRELRRLIENGPKPARIEEEREQATAPGAPLFRFTLIVSFINTSTE